MATNARAIVRSAMAVLALSGLLAAPVHAQFGRLIPRDVRNVTNDAADTDACGNEKKSSAGSRVLGGILGRTARSAAGRSGVGAYVPLPDFGDQISKEIACKLDPEEQAQAADATLRATRSDEYAASDDSGVPQIGSSASWTSQTRDGVSGTSTVTAREETPGDLDCITVTDVIIVNGEETTANKRMCRRSGAGRYTIVA